MFVGLLLICNDVEVVYPDDNEKPVEEVYEALTPHELARLFAYIIATKGEAGKELLKPLKMAKTSARSFWNVISHFGDVEGGLKAIFPRLDWCVLEMKY